MASLLIFGNFIGIQNIQFNHKRHENFEPCSNNLNFWLERL